MNNLFSRIKQFVVVRYIKFLKEPQQKLHIGTDSLFSLVKDMKKEKFKKTLIVTDKTIVSLNLIGSLLSMLKSNNIYPEGEFIESALFKEKLVKPTNVYTQENLFSNYTVVKSDIDIYHHMNNAKYAEILFNNCDYQAVEIKRFAVNYLRQSKEKQIIDIYKQVENNITYITGVIDNEVIFTSLVERK